MSSDTDAINVQVSPEQKDLIDKAAQLLGKSSADFIRDLAVQHAGQVLDGQRDFRLSEARWDALMANLDPPSGGTSGLRTKLRRPG